MSLRDAGALAAHPVPASRSAMHAEGAAPFVRVSVLGSLAEAEAAWRRLEAVAPASPYQTFAWASAWMETEGVALGMHACIGIAWDERGQPVALLPFGLIRRKLLQVVTFFGGRHANYNLGLFDPAARWTAASVRRLLRAVAASAGRVDVFALVNQPVEWRGSRNPLALLPHQGSPSDSHRAVLTPDAEAFLHRHQSAAARKKLRSKTRQLNALGPVAHGVAREPAEVEAILDAYRLQKGSKLAAIGAEASEAALARSYRLYARAALGPAPVLELHALRCGGRIVATFGGLIHAGHFSGQMISHDTDPAYARLSPGDILLTAVTSAQCVAGRTGFDLGIGESRYKQSLCPIIDPLVDSLVPVSLPGHLFVAAEMLRLKLKRAIKRSPWVWPLALAARRWLAALDPRR